MLLSHQRDPHRVHLEAVDVLAAAGFPPPADWTAIRDRWAAFINTTSTMGDQLAAALLDGAEADQLATLRALALAEASATQPDVAHVNNTARIAVTKRLRDIYNPVAADTYAAVAARFTKHAAEFTTAAGIVDPEAQADSIVGADAKIRKAWTDAQLAAQHITAMLPPMVAAADLAGHPADTAEALLPLVCDPADIHRRKVWEAWETEGRCGRWSALHALGAKIRPANLDDHAAYRRPMPMQEKWVQVSRGTHQRLVVDPEDEPSTPFANA